MTRDWRIIITTEIAWLGRENVSRRDTHQKGWKQTGQCAINGGQQNKGSSALLEVYCQTSHLHMIKSEVRDSPRLWWISGIAKARICPYSIRLRREKETLLKARNNTSKRVRQRLSRNLSCSSITGDEDNSIHPGWHYMREWLARVFGGY